MRARLLEVMEQRAVEPMALDLLQEIERVRTKVVPQYVKMGPMGAGLLKSCLAVLEGAAAAVLRNDGVMCLRMLQSLQRY